MKEEDRNGIVVYATQMIRELEFRCKRCPFHCISLTREEETPWRN